MFKRSQTTWIWGDSTETCIVENGKKQQLTQIWLHRTLTCDLWPREETGCYYMSVLCIFVSIYKTAHVIREEAMLSWLSCVLLKFEDHLPREEAEFYYLALLRVSLKRQHISRVGKRRSFDNMKIWLRDALWNSLEWERYGILWHRNPPHFFMKWKNVTSKLRRCFGNIETPLCVESWKARQ